MPWLIEKAKEKSEALRQLLETGWEPFGVVGPNHQYKVGEGIKEPNMIYLKRQETPF